MKDTILKHLIKNDHLPLLFVGSGMSIRYLGLENWEDLLRRFAVEAAATELGYEMYVQAAKALECKEGLLPKVAELIEKDFNMRWFKEEKYKKTREDHAEEVKRGVSPFKVEIASHMRGKSHNAEYAKEIELFTKLGMRSISGAVTTNYDSFLEDAFPTYTTYIGQEELIFSTLHGISEIYKIHGCCTKAESIVINEADYLGFTERNAYLAAKILTLFLEHPIIFLGYSVSDTNIENILKSIVRCLSVANLERIKERLFIVEYVEDIGLEGISSYSKAFEGGKSIEMTRIRLKSYEPLYQAMLENQAKYNAPMLRRLKQDIYDLVLTNRPTGKIRAVNLEDEKLEDVEVVIGVGILAEFGKKGYRGLRAEEIYSDVVLDDRSFDAESIITEALPSLLPHNSNMLPVHKYLSQYEGEPPEVVKVAIKPTFDSLLSNTIMKNRRKSSNREETIASLLRKFPGQVSKCLQELPHLRPENLNVDELREFLSQVLTDKPWSKEPNFKTALKRAIRIYDWLRYHA